MVSATRAQIRYFSGVLLGSSKICLRLHLNGGGISYVWWTIHPIMFYVFGVLCRYVIGQFVCLFFIFSVANHQL